MDNFGGGGISDSALLQMGSDFNSVNYLYEYDARRLIALRHLHPNPNMCSRDQCVQMIHDDNRRILQRGQIPAVPIPPPEAASAPPSAPFEQGMSHQYQAPGGMSSGGMSSGGMSSGGMSSGGFNRPKIPPTTYGQLLFSMREVMERSRANNSENTKKSGPPGVLKNIIKAAAAHGIEQARHSKYGRKLERFLGGETLIPMLTCSHKINLHSPFHL
ncbi:hypothetical protein HOP50_04g31170 [Chloropicon primus]|uniref:Uncharacterized protein n=1 Tax=Chloropicon primus TaxID=1764295 RepID=A0A5B8MJJ3_9CHLO|nr:hypothetical protein A3770_04p31150 [Chloropicon primus]UPQ99808.1 hypothetical protein HOP50_04g31170 [Chloropicon primus]|eukprot:QDZ20597.1 hypothetical protein A3770_04p31150 [Chloropicon primus]